ncbi:MAG: CpaF family protein [Lachnospiraceae bacterium]
MNEETIKQIKKDILAAIDITREISDEQVEEIIYKVIRKAVRKEYLDISARQKLSKDIFNSLRRMDVLQDFLEDDEITEIMVNGPDNIFYEKDGKLFLSDRHFESIEKLEDIIQKIASGVNRTVNEAQPIVDARLKDGSRVNIVLSPVSLGGPAVTIRKFTRDIMHMSQLTETGFVSEEAAAFLRKLVCGHYNILCSGGTGCGKTTMLNALSGYILSGERVITIEDSAELIMDNLTNLVRLEAREANAEGKNEITIRKLIKTALRMRPSRIIVGEVRGREAIDMLQSLNTGHCGMSTLHANSPEDALSRLETMVLLDENIPLAAIRSQIASAVDIIIGISRMRDGSRHVTEICEVDGIKDGKICLNTIFKFMENEETDEAFTVKGRLVKTGSLIHCEKLIAAGIRP